MSTKKKPGTSSSRLSVPKTVSSEKRKDRIGRSKGDQGSRRDCEMVTLPYYTSEMDVNKIGPSIAVCTELLDQIGHDEMLNVIKKYGKNFIEENKYAHLPKKKRMKLEKEREKKWATCPNRVSICPHGGLSVAGCCACGIPPSFFNTEAPKAQPEPGSIGVSLNHIAFHTNAPSDQILPPTDPCVLKLGKLGDSQCITLQYEAEPVIPYAAPPFYERQVQVVESELDSFANKDGGKEKGKKGRGKSKQSGKSQGKGKDKGKGKGKGGSGKSKGKGKKKK